MSDLPRIEAVRRRTESIERQKLAMAALMGVIIASGVIKLCYGDPTPLDYLPAILDAPVGMILGSGVMAWQEHRSDH